MECTTVPKDRDVDMVGMEITPAAVFVVVEMVAVVVQVTRGIT
ncbi:MAG: hypothetical protein AAF471_08880 [Myxococcota bacterium]